MKLEIVILSIIICFSQSGQAFADPQKPSGSGELIIRVKSSEGPVEGATIVLTIPVAGQRLDVSTAEGVCEFRGLRAGTYSLQVIQRSFFPTEESESQMDHVEIRNGQSQSVNFYLVKGGVLKGRAVSTEGSPIIGMPISALKLAGKEPSLPSAKESNVTAISDDRGEFRIYGLRPGSYTVAVNANRNASPMKSLGTLFYPGERESANATTFDLLPGQEVSIPDMVLDLTRENQNSLSGVVQEAHAKPLKGVSLALRSVDGSQISDSTLSDEQGFFNFEGLPAGQYFLKATFNGEGYFNLQRQILIKDLTTNKVTLELRPLLLISGRAYLRSKTGVAPLPSLRLQLEPAQNGRDKIELVTDKDGAFSQRSSSDGSFWWNFPELPPEYFVNRILLDGKEITNRPVKLDQASDLRGVSIELSAGAAEIRGVVQGGTCRGNLIYAIALLSKSDDIQFVRKANCSADSFRIQSLAPGRYFVVGISTSNAVNKSNQGVRTKQQGIDDKHYDAMEQIVKTLKTKGTKAVTLDSGQIHETTQPILIVPKMDHL